MPDRTSGQVDDGDTWAGGDPYADPGEPRLHTVPPNTRMITPADARRVTREAFTAVNRRRIPALGLFLGLGAAGLASWWRYRR